MSSTGFSGCSYFGSLEVSLRDLFDRNGFFFLLKQDPKRYVLFLFFIFLNQVVFSFCVERKIDVWKPRKRDSKYFHILPGILYQRRQNKTGACRQVWKHRSCFSSSAFIYLITYLFIYFVGKDQINMAPPWGVHIQTKKKKKKNDSSV